MPRPATTSEFLELVRGSGVVDAQALADWLAQARPVLPENDPGRVAAMLVDDALLTSFQAEQILQGKWRRFSIGSCRVLEKIGSGNMGSVYLCKHDLLQRVVALKVLPSALAADVAMASRLVNESHILASLDHGNIVRCFQVGADNNLHFIALEYVDGANLHDIVKRTAPLSVLRAAHYIRQAALALQYVHARGIIHHDIEPSNLVVDRRGVLKVIDFGLSRLCVYSDDDGAPPIRDGARLLANPKYLAPEYALHRYADNRADIYSLGAVFYFCLSGRSLFGGGTQQQLINWHQASEPKPIQSRRPEVADGLAAIVHKMLAKDPAQRFQSAGEVAEALIPWTREPDAPPPDSEMPRLSPAARNAVRSCRRG